MSRWYLFGLVGAAVLSLAAPTSADAAMPHAPLPNGQVVSGTLQFKPETPDPSAPNARTPVEGAVVEVFGATLSIDGRKVEELGELLGSATSDAEGTFVFEMPAGAGDYAVRLVLETLPAGVGLVDATKQTLPVRLAEGQSKAILFNLAEGDAATAGVPSRGDPWYERMARLAVNGLQFGLIIGMCAIGLSLIYGTTGLVNFAHSEMITLGAVLAWMFNVTFGVPLVLAAVLAMVIGAGAGALIDRGLWRPLRKRNTGLIAMSIVSIGLGLFMQYAILYQFGDRPAKYADYSVQTKSISFGPISLSPKEIIIMVLSALILVAVALGLRYTRLGKAMRAVSDNPDLAASTGIDVDRIITLVWTLGAALVTLGAVFQGVSETVSWTMGQQLLLLVFASVTLGGLGTAFGAMAGSIIVGVAILTVTVWWPSELQTVPALFLMIVILMVRPQGLFGRRERIG
ncbi:MAG: branched-chain amino acid ABC transporter permease [Actinomycetota bacterium]|nr:branched-chain amino acid ABC transporter permease [Actinomycetota bacterium]